MNQRDWFLLRCVPSKHGFYEEGFWARGGGGREAFRQHLLPVLEQMDLNKVENVLKHRGA